MLTASIVTQDLVILFLIITNLTYGMCHRLDIFFNDKSVKFRLIGSSPIIVHFRFIKMAAPGHSPEGGCSCRPSSSWMAAGPAAVVAQHWRRPAASCWSSSPSPHSAPPVM